MNDIISTNRDIDAACARALGKPWTKPTHGRCCTCQDCGWDHDNCQCGYSEDHEKARLLEDEIERRGLQYKYMDWLMAFTSLCSNENDQHWALIRATPEQKARAFLKAVEAE